MISKKCEFVPLSHLKTQNFIYDQLNYLPFSSFLATKSRIIIFFFTIFIRFLIIFTWLSNGLWGRMFTHTNTRTKLFVATQYLDSNVILGQLYEENKYKQQSTISSFYRNRHINMTNYNINDHVMNCFLTQQDTICCGNNGYSF